MISMSVDDIFAQTLIDGYDADAPWEAVRTLQTIGNREVFDRAAAWCNSRNPMERARGADVLAQLGTTEHVSNAYPQESFEVISALVQAEGEPIPLGAAIHALGHIGNPLAIPLVAKYRTHSDPEIRFATACALGSFSGDPLAVEALLSLTRDVDDDVRDWATFGIGTLGKLDSAEIRETLVSRLSDSFEAVRQEAMAGLVRLKDERVLSVLLSALEQPAVADLTIDAAAEMLGKQGCVVGWRGEDYAEAIRERFRR